MVFSILMPLTGAVKQQIFGSLSDSLFFKPAQPNTQIIYELGKVKYLNTFECAAEATEGQNSGWAVIQLRYFDETGLTFNSAEIWRSNYPLQPFDPFGPHCSAGPSLLVNAAFEVDDRRDKQAGNRIPLWVPNKTESRLLCLKMKRKRGWPRKKSMIYTLIQMVLNDQYVHKDLVFSHHVNK